MPEDKYILCEFCGNKDKECENCFSYSHYLNTTDKLPKACEECKDETICTTACVHFYEA